MCDFIEGLCEQIEMLNKIIIESVKARTSRQVFLQPLPDDSLDICDVVSGLARQSRFTASIHDQVWLINYHLEVGWGGGYWLYHMAWKYKFKIF